MVSRSDVSGLQGRLIPLEDGVVKIQVHADPFLFDRDGQVEIAILGIPPLGHQGQLAHEIIGEVCRSALTLLIVPVREGIFGDLYLFVVVGGLFHLPPLFRSPKLAHVKQGVERYLEQHLLVVLGRGWSFIWGYCFDDCSALFLVIDEHSDTAFALHGLPVSYGVLQGLAQWLSAHQLWHLLVDAV